MFPPSECSPQSAAIDGLRIYPLSVDRLPVNRTDAYTPPALPHDQSRMDGLFRILKNHITLVKDLFTIKRLWSLKRHRTRDISPYERLQWTVLAFQFFKDVARLIHRDSGWGSS